MSPHDAHHDPDPAEQAALLILKSAGESLTREGLLRTPARFSRAMRDLLSGYRQSVEAVVGSGIFPAEGPGLVSVRQIEFYSLCEHHVLPFWGSVSVAYYPDRSIVGLSKIPRIVDVFSRRLQVQERLTREIGEGLREAVRPRAVVVRATASHLCMRMRGVEKQHSDALTEYAWGVDSLTADEKARLWKALD